MTDDALDEGGGNGPCEDSPPSDHPSQLPDGPSLDDLIALLTHERRRRLLAYLTERPGESVPMGKLEDVVTEDAAPGSVPSRRPEPVEIDLYHVHLPKLADAAVIQFDREARTVCYVGPDELAELVDATKALEATE